MTNNPEILKQVEEFYNKQKNILRQPCPQQKKEGLELRLLAENR